ncbi:carbonic anhydrase [Entomomonas moraniae]|nr:carbonic anhydrase family protein [Entomomonas moraniae]
MKLNACLLFVSLVSVNYAIANDQWGYQGNISPEHWGEISKDFSACKAGKHQSPINIATSKKLHHHELSFHYDLTAEELVNNGHTVQINVNSDNDYLIYKNDKYYLKQFHFHTPSENQIHGKSYPLEVHFVHANKEGKLLVLAVMANEGKANQELAKAWSVVSDKQNQAVAVKDTFDISKFIPADHGYYHFEGSLTTPPCTEDVNWLILKTPVEVSKEQIAKFAALLKDHHNNRPIQPINDREVDEE